MRNDILMTASLDLDFGTRIASVGGVVTEISDAFQFVRDSTAQGSTSGGPSISFAANRPRLVRQANVTGLALERASGGRAAELAGISTAGQPWFDPTKGTIYFEGWWTGASNLDHVLFHARNAPGEFFEVASEASSQKLKALGFAGGAVTAYAELPGFQTSPRMIRAALRYAAGAWSFAASGLFFPTDGVFPSIEAIKPATVGSGQVANVSEIHIGHRSAGSQFDGIISRFSYLPTQLSDLDMTALVHA